MCWRWIGGALALTALAACGGGGAEGPYPSREIKLVVQASPGGTSDTVSRVMASLAEGELGVPIVCENKPGASGALAFSYVVRRPPDGYTIGHAPVEIAMVRSLGYADVGPEQMSLICLVSKTPPALVVRADSEWKTLDDYVQAAKKQPGGLIMANSGVGSIWHFNTLLLEQNAGVRVTHLPYPGSSGALVALLGGHVDAVVAGVGEVVAHVQAGKLRPLAVFDESRTSVFPDTPTTYELGYAIGAPAWSGFFGPQGMPSADVDKLAAAFGDAFKTEQWQKLCRERGMTPAYMGRSEFEAFAKQQAQFFGAEIPELLRMQR
ncbi:MAG: tripartite tricarboxylate transporter substrate binding protein [Acidobacteria bacterium]|nr:tripartite tricarboxylate transporter substrate binding protein [Acidobacteriota bacterium]